MPQTDIKEQTPNMEPRGGVDQALYGTDVPYLRRDLRVNSKQRIPQSTELEGQERIILEENTARLFFPDCAFKFGKAVQRQ